MVEKRNNHKITTEIMLSELMTILAGYPFRGRISDIPSEILKALQAKDLSELDELREDNLIIPNLTKKRDADWL